MSNWKEQAIKAAEERDKNNQQQEIETREAETASAKADLVDRLKDFGIVVEPSAVTVNFAGYSFRGTPEVTVDGIRFRLSRNTADWRIQIVETCPHCESTISGYGLGRYDKAALGDELLRIERGELPGHTCESEEERQIQALNEATLESRPRTMTPAQEQLLDALENYIAHYAPSPETE